MLKPISEVMKAKYWVVSFGLFYSKIITALTAVRYQTVREIQSMTLSPVENYVTNFFANVGIQ